MKIAIIGGLILALLGGGVGLFSGITESVNKVSSIITWFVDNLVWIILFLFIAFLLYFIFVVKKQEKRGKKR